MARPVVLAGDFHRVSGLLKRSVVPVSYTGHARQIHIRVILDGNRFSMCHGKEGEAKRLARPRIRIVNDRIAFIG